MTIVAGALMSFTATASGAPTGLVGTIGVEVVDEHGTAVIAHTTADIVELVAGSGVYLWACAAAPAVLGEYELVWDDGSGGFANEDLIVTLLPEGVGPSMGTPPYPMIALIREQAQQQQRAVRARPFVASYTFGWDGDALPDTDTPVTVSVVNAEGFLVVNDASATVESVVSGMQQVELPMSASTMPQRDIFTCLWSATVGGTAVVAISTIDVCDSRLFPLVDYAQYPELAARGFTAAVLEQHRMWAEDRIEYECGCAFTGRYGEETHTLGVQAVWSGFAGTGFAGRDRAGIVRLPLRQPNVLALRSITQTTVEDDVATVVALDLANARVDGFSGMLLYRDPSGHGLYGDVVVAYEHGRPEADARRAALILARYRLLNGPLDQRAVSMPAEGGGTISLLTPGVAGSVFGIPELDLFIQRHAHRAQGFVSAGI